MALPRSPTPLLPEDAYVANFGFEVVGLTSVTMAADRGPPQPAAPARPVVLVRRRPRRLGPRRRHLGFYPRAAPATRSRPSPTRCTSARTRCSPPGCGWCGAGRPRRAGLIDASIAAAGAGPAVLGVRHAAGRETGGVASARAASRWRTRPPTCCCWCCSPGCSPGRAATTASYLAARRSFACC